MKEYIKDVPKSNKPRKILAMLIHFGELKNGKTCIQCCHLKKYGWRGKNYYKCEVYGISNSEATDWRLYYPACGAFNVEAIEKRDLYKELWHSPKAKKDDEPLKGQIKMDFSLGDGLPYCRWIVREGNGTPYWAMTTCKRGFNPLTKVKHVGEIKKVYDGCYCPICGRPIKTSGYVFNDDFEESEVEP